MGIPSGYGISRVKATEYFGPIMLDFFRNKIAEESVHVYAYTCLNGKWIKCDTSTDRLLSEKTSCFNCSTELVQWDRDKDATDRILPGHIIEDSGPFEDIDSRRDKKVRHVNIPKIKLANSYLRFLRHHDGEFERREYIDREFSKWLRKNNFLFYLYFKIGTSLE